MLFCSKAFTVSVLEPNSSCLNLLHSFCCVPWGCISEDLATPCLCLSAPLPLPTYRLGAWGWPTASIACSTRYLGLAALRPRGISPKQDLAMGLG